MKSAFLSAFQPSGLFEHSTAPRCSRNVPNTEARNTFWERFEQGVSAVLAILGSCLGSAALCCGSVSFHQLRLPYLGSVTPFAAITPRSKQTCVMGSLSPWLLDLNAPEAEQPLFSAPIPIPSAKVQRIRPRAVSVEALPELETSETLVPTHSSPPCSDWHCQQHVRKPRTSFGFSRVCYHCERPI